MTYSPLIALTETVARYEVTGFQDEESPGRQLQAIAERVAQDVLEATGYWLVVNTPAGPTLPGARDQPAARAIDIPLARIQLTAAQRGQPLDQDKTRKELARARRNGNRVEPIRVRRLNDGYRVLDGVRRLRVAEALGLATVPAVVEE